MAVSETTVKVDRRYLRNKTKDDLIVLILQLMDIGAKKDVEIQRLKDKTLVMKAYDAKKTIEIERLKGELDELKHEQGLCGDDCTLCADYLQEEPSDE